MAKRDNKVFFAWEKRTGVLGFFGRARIRQLLLGAAVLSITVGLFAREADARKVRSTRAGIGVMFRAVSAYRADHGGACPKDTVELKTGAYVAELPKDAWGHTIRVVCPGQRDKLGFDVMSDGPGDLLFSKVE